MSWYSSRSIQVCVCIREMKGDIVAFRSFLDIYNIYTYTFST